MINTTTHQESHTLISVKGIQISDSSFSTSRDAISHSWWMVPMRAWVCKFQLMIIIAKFHTCTVISLILSFYKHYSWWLGSVHLRSHHPKFHLFDMEKTKALTGKVSWQIVGRNTVNLCPFIPSPMFGSVPLQNPKNQGVWEIHLDKEKPAEELP